MTEVSEQQDLVIATPELVAFGYQTAGIGSRFLAALAICWALSI